MAHVKTEFGFDVLEVAKGRYAPDAYRDFIGFEVAQPGKASKTISSSVQDWRFATARKCGPS